MKHVNLLLAFAILLAGCIKSNRKGHEQDYEHGRLLLELNDSVNMTDVIDICSDADVSILKVVGFNFISSFPPDSADRIKQALYSRDYIEPRSIDRAVIPSISLNKIFLTGLRFNDMTSAKLQDFSYLLDSLQL